MPENIDDTRVEPARGWRPSARHNWGKYQTEVVGFQGSATPLEGRPVAEVRKLAAILVADIVGYSRLAGADEERTLARVRGLRSGFG